MNLERVQAVRTFFAERGIEAYLVGGTVRDLLLGKRDLLADMDWVVARGRDPLELTRELADTLGGRFVPLDAEHGTARVVFMEDAAGVVRSIVDLAEMRAATLREDLALRDFTINAIALDPAKLVPGSNPAEASIDPHNGRADLQQRLVRAVSERAFVDDPVRLLRAVRLAAKLDFEIEAHTAELIRKYAYYILEPARERVRDEVLKTLNREDSTRYLQMYADLRLLSYIFPEVDEPAEPVARAARVDSILAASAVQIKDFLHEPLVDGAGSERSRAVTLRLAALLAHAGVEGAVAALEHLRMSRNEVRTATISLRLLPVLDAFYVAGGGSRSDRWAFYRAAGNETIAAVVLWLALREGDPDRQIFLDAALHERPAMLRLQPLLSGDDIQREFQLEPGLQIGQLLDAVRAAQLDGRLHSRADAIDYIYALLHTR